MLDFLPYITNANVMAFMLLLLRFGGILAFFPFFDNQLVPLSVRAALAFVLAVVFMPLVKDVIVYNSLSEFMLAGIFEVLLGFVCGLVLQIIFSSIVFAGDLASFTMGLTMASAYDPMSGATKPIVSQVIVFLALLAALHFNFHYMLLEIIAKSINETPLGGFRLHDDALRYFIGAFADMIVIGFSMAFPVVAVLLLSDIIFGMIMKTHPQFNLLVIGFPVKIGIALVIIALIVPSFIEIFRDDLSEGMKVIWKILSNN